MSTLIIDESNYVQAIEERLNRFDPTERNFEPGCRPRQSDYGNIQGVPRATDFIKPIPREEWADLIKDGKGTWLHDLSKDKLPPHDQGGTNYCWAHGSVRAAEILRVFEGQPPLTLSAESVAVPVTGGRNRGGSPDEALQQMMRYGMCDQYLWPHNDRDERHAKDGWEANALRHRTIRWADTQGFDMQMTFAFMRIPVPIGLGWWGHLVCQLDPIHFGGKDFGIGCDNSWGNNYGDNGYFELTERRGTADLGSFALLTENFSLK